MNKITKVLLLLAVFFNTACDDSGNTIDIYGSIEGTVYDSNGNSIGNCEIFLTPSNQSYHTNSDGTYCFHELQSGNYTLSFSKKGYSSLTMTYHVDAGNITVADVQLVKTTILISAQPLVLDFSISEVLSVTLTNPDEAPHTFEIDDSSFPVGISVSPQHGAIPIGGKTVISINADKSKISTMSASINICIDDSYFLEIRMLFPSIQPKDLAVAIKIQNLTDSSFEYFFEVGNEVDGLYVYKDDIPIQSAADVVTKGEKKSSTTIVTSYNHFPEAHWFIYAIPYGSDGNLGEVAVQEVSTLPLKKDVTKTLSADYELLPGKVVFNFKKASKNDFLFSCLYYSSDPEDIEPFGLDYCSNSSAPISDKITSQMYRSYYVNGEEDYYYMPSIEKITYTFKENSKVLVLYAFTVDYSSLIPGLLLKKIIYL